MGDKYIRKQDVSDWLKQYGRDVLHGKYKFSLMYIWKNIMDLPSADVVQVRHSRWIKYTGMGKVQWMCSECSAEEKNPKVANYCYYCGAKMDGKYEEEE